MQERRKSLNILDLHELTKDRNAVTVTIGQIGADVLNMHVKKYLSIGELVSFVNDMKDAEFNQATNEYSPGIGLISYKLALVRLYTDLELPDDLNLAYQIINEFNIDTKIIDVLQDTEQYKDLWEAIERAMNYKRDSTIGMNMLYKTVADAIGSLPWKELGSQIEAYLDPQKIQQLVDTFVNNFS